MHRAGLIFAYLGGTAAFFALVLYLFVTSFYPQTGPAPSLTVEATPASLERGAYLVEHVTQCFACHGEVDATAPGSPVKPETRGGVGRSWVADAEGHRAIAPNISPSALSSWSDGEVAQATFVGVAPQERILDPAMPYPHYGFMCLEDRLAVLGYLRTIPRVEGQDRDPTPPMMTGLLRRMIPRELPVSTCDAERTGEDLGTYLVTVAGCGGCHTPLRRGVPDLERAFAGGRRMHGHDGQEVTSANLTPHPRDGLGEWDEARFIAAFREHAAQPSPRAPMQGAPMQGSPMPWAGYAGLTDSDLAAMFSYLQSLPAVASAAP